MSQILPCAALALLGQRELWVTAPYVYMARAPEARYSIGMQILYHAGSYTIIYIIWHLSSNRVVRYFFGHRPAHLQLVRLLWLPSMPHRNAVSYWTNLGSMGQWSESVWCLALLFPWYSVIQCYGFRDPPLRRVSKDSLLKKIPHLPFSVHVGNVYDVRTWLTDKHTYHSVPDGCWGIQPIPAWQSLTLSHELSTDKFASNVVIQKSAQSPDLLGNSSEFYMYIHIGVFASCIAQA